MRHFSRIILLALWSVNVAWAGDDAAAVSTESQGWHWYNMPAEAQDESPSPPPTDPLLSLTPSEQKKVLQQATREALDTAILYPTTANFRRFMTLQNFWTDQATAFTQTSKKARLAFPELDYNLQRSHYNGTAAVQQKETQTRASLAVHQVAERYGLFFFYRGNNPVDALMAGVIKTYCADRGIPLIPVSVDGKKSDQLPQSRLDSGQAEHMQVRFFPATFLVDPRSRQWQPLAYGFMSHDDLDRQVLNVLTDFKPEY